MSVVSQPVDLIPSQILSSVLDLFPTNSNNETSIIRVKLIKTAE